MPTDEQVEELAMELRYEHSGRYSVDAYWPAMHERARDRYRRMARYVLENYRRVGA